VVDGSPAHVGVARVDGGVDRRALFREAWPTAFGAGDYARPDAIAYIRDGKERATSVGDAHLVSGGDASGRRVVGMDQQRCCSGSLLLPCRVGEDGIQKVVIGWCDEGERILAGEGGVVLRGLVRGRVARDGIQSGMRHSIGDEFQLPGCGGKGVSERHERIGIVQPHPTASLQFVECDASQ